MSIPFRVTVDQTGFPMIGITELNFLISWLPVTKIQFEQFMCDTNLFEDTWYQEMLKNYTPRVSPGVMRLGDYWNIYMTGITPSEAVRFANWMGREYSLPTSQEWKEALSVLARYPALPEYVDTVAKFEDTTNKQMISERAALICRKLEEITVADSSQLVASAGRRLCDQMMMRLGVIEYVYEDSQMNTFAGWGQPNRRFFGGAFNPIRDTKPLQLVNRAEGTRMKHVGFRLIRRQR